MESVSTRHVNILPRFCSVWCNALCVHTHVFIGGLVGADQVGMEAWEAHDGPHREETHHHFQHSDTKKSRNNSAVVFMQWQMIIWKLIQPTEPARTPRCCRSSEHTDPQPEGRPPLASTSQLPVRLARTAHFLYSTYTHCSRWILYTNKHRWLLMCTTSKDDTYKYPDTITKCLKGCWKMLSRLASYCILSETLHNALTLFFSLLQSLPPQQGQNMSSFFEHKGLLR